MAEEIKEETAAEMTAAPENVAAEETAAAETVVKQKTAEEFINAEEPVREEKPVKAEEPAPAEEPAKIEEAAPEKEERQPKEKKPCKLVSFFANSKSGGELAGKCVLMLVISAVLAYLSLLLWGVIDLLCVTFVYAAYCAVATAGLILLAGLVLIVLMIVRYVKKK